MYDLCCLIFNAIIGITQCVATLGTASYIYNRGSQRMKPVLKIRSICEKLDRMTRLCKICSIVLCKDPVLVSSGRRLAVSRICSLLVISRKRLVTLDGIPLTVMRTTWCLVPCAGTK